jgi:hypothetical protein
VKQRPGAVLSRMGTRPAPMPRSANRWGDKGPKLWARLHNATGITQAWLDAFTAEIPCGTCKDHWRAMMQATPPPLGDDAAMFAWGVDRHNEVNVRLGKAVMTLGEARVR